MTETTIGIDISKDHLDVHRLPGDEHKRFDNTAAGHKALIRWIGAVPARVVYEPTGPYHRKLEVQLAAAGMPIVKVNPRQAKRFAEATGQRAKTDRLDAAMLARMGALLGLEPRPVRSAILNDLKDLHLAREALVKDRTAAKNRGKSISLPLLKRQNEARLRQINQQLEAIDAAIKALIDADPALSARFAILVSIPGVAAVTAAMLVTEMPELGSLDPRQAAALAGLAPITRQSGQWKGKAFVHGGRKQVRQALYMPALVATRFNPDLKAKYQQLVATGKAPKQAITAVMRKLIVLANALLKKGAPWQPSSA
ncbi:MAG: IS110 family transposase [Alphaproteobacteria bacterium]|jgi:transposase|nr:IS110 family transposase [Alphaproteobacteria bacterium]